MGPAVSIADFVRRDHHERGKTTLELHPFVQQLVDDGDSVFEPLPTSVSGTVSRHDLADESRFPERDVFDGKVNVRFFARLLRIGDLLDMSSKRAGSDDRPSCRSAALGCGATLAAILSQETREHHAEDHRVYVRVQGPGRPPSTSRLVRLA